jgi:hypothetical protein
MSLAEYDAVVPGTAERLVALQVREQEARLDWERRQHDADVDHELASADRARAEAESRRVRASTRAEIDLAKAESRRRLARARAFEIRGSMALEIVVTGTAVAVLGGFGVVAIAVGEPIVAMAGIAPAVLVTVGHVLTARRGRRR